MKFSKCGVSPAQPAPLLLWNEILLYEGIYEPVPNSRSINQAGVGTIRMVVLKGAQPSSLAPQAIAVALCVNLTWGTVVVANLTAWSDYKFRKTDEQLSLNIKE